MSSFISKKQHHRRHDRHHDNKGKEIVYHVSLSAVALQQHPIYSIPIVYTIVPFMYEELLVSSFLRVQMLFFLRLRLFMQNTGPKTGLPVAVLLSAKEEQKQMSFYTKEKIYKVEIYSNLVFSI